MREDALGERRGVYSFLLFFFFFFVFVRKPRHHVCAFKDNFCGLPPLGLPSCLKGEETVGYSEIVT